MKATTHTKIEGKYISGIAMAKIWLAKIIGKHRSQPY